MADWVTISSLATAGGTLVLAVATFSSVKSSNRSARIAEQSLLVGMRPVLIPSREDDPTEHVRFPERLVVVPGHRAAIEATEDVIYLAMALRNGGAGLAVIHGWRVGVSDPNISQSEQIGQRPDADEFRRQQLDLYIPAGDTGFWQGALRDPQDPVQATVRSALGGGERVLLDLLYGDHEGGQRAVARFGIVADDDGQGRRAMILRYFNLDRDDPR